MPLRRFQSFNKFLKLFFQNSTLDDILGIHPESGIFSSDESFNVTRVYRAEIPPLHALQVNKFMFKRIKNPICVNIN